VHKLAVFGVFDGHGGKQAAVYASRHLHAHLQTALREPDAAAPAVDSSAAAGSGDTGEAATEAADLRAQLLTLGASPEALAACDAVDGVAAALPQALAAAFAVTEQAFISHSQVQKRRSIAQKMACAAPTDTSL
jgi:serine/threonine protein phosphatase PrpC